MPTVSSRRTPYHRIGSTGWIQVIWAGRNSLLTTRCWSCANMRKELTTNRSSDQLQTWVHREIGQRDHHSMPGSLAAPPSWIPSASHPPTSLSRRGTTWLVRDSSRSATRAITWQKHSTSQQRSEFPVNSPHEWVLKAMASLIYENIGYFYHTYWAWKLNL